MGYAAYPELKDAGVPWLGEVPAKWNFKRLKFAVSLINDKVNAEETEFPYMGLEHIESWSGRRIEDSLASSEGIATRFRSGDVLFGKLRPYLAKVHLAKHEGIATTEALVLRHSKEICAPFLRYYLVSTDFIDLVDSSTYGSKMPRANWDFIGNLPLLLPAIEEQRAIARFLDHKTAQIDALIAKKEALLQKLAEKRTALISHAVTKGLDPTTPTNDSGWAWLGKIPSHWTIGSKLGYLSASRRHSFVNGPFGSDLLTSELVDEGVPVIYSGDVKPGQFVRKSRSYVTEEKANQLNFCRVDAGDLLLAKVGNPPGDAAIYPDGEPAGIVTQDVVRIKVDTTIASTNYLCYFLNSTPGRHIVKLICVEATRGRFSLEDFKSLRIFLPPLKEQHKVVTHIDQALKPIERQRSSILLAIEKLNEYRSALITAAVTGKIDVRNVAIPEGA